jgi:ubiquinone/menaquinone biosynthesis C-methylase UbiE
MEGRKLAPYYSSGDALRAKHARAAKSGVAVGRALDAGCGWGRFAVVLAQFLPADSELVCTDLFPGMVQTAREALADVERLKRFVVADIEDLPIVDGVVDLAMANHVLYHLRDIAQGLREFGRVLVPDGTFVATANSDAIHVPVVDAHDETLRRLGVVVETTESSGFSMENGLELLSEHFEDVTEHVFRDEQLCDVDNLCASYLNTGRFRTIADDETVPAELRARVPEVYRQVAAELADDGAIRSPFLMATYVCHGARKYF